MLWKLSNKRLLPAAIGEEVSSEYILCHGRPSSSSIRAIATSSGNEGTFKDQQGSQLWKRIELKLWAWWQEKIAIQLIYPVE